MNEAAERVILVDADDRTLGTASKLEAHERGELHRAFSVLIHDGDGNMLLQKRHPGKYHSGGLWTNACCGHPRPGEETLAAASRRLAEEMGFSCPLRPLSSLVYRADVGGGLVEHELVHLFTGVWRGSIAPHAYEVETYAWWPLYSVRQAAATSPDRFTAWFRIYIAEVLSNPNFTGAGDDSLSGSP